MSSAVPRRTLLAPEDRRRQLLEAAIWVFARKGYRRAGISDIIARAGVARGTFYLHFKSKEQVFLAIVEDFHGRITRALAGTVDPAALAADGGPRALLYASARRWIEFFASHRDAATVILKEASSIDPRFEKGFAALRQSAASFFAARLRRLQELGLANAKLSPELFARLQLGMFDELLSVFVLGNEQADLDALADQLAEFEWNGIRPDRRE
jgi:TetR/AcrR family transcriptional regulator, fatty acid metabolism regulator protein